MPMPDSSPHPARLVRTAFAAVAISVLLASCATSTETEEGAVTVKPGTPTWEGHPIGSPPPPDPSLKRAIMARALREWEFFGRQTVVIQGNEESIPHVGAWEDDDSRHSGRVSVYWRTVGKSSLSGMDCQQPWSAAFMTWVMRSAGVPEEQFPNSSAHWIYMANMINQAGLPDRYFVPRRVRDYSPRLGDLVCAYRGSDRPPSNDGYTSSWMLPGTNSHCDLVVGKNGASLDVVGGNVRNSVSKTTLELDAQGHLKPGARRPWFLILENRL